MEEVFPKLSAVPQPDKRRSILHHCCTRGATPDHARNPAPQSCRQQNPLHGQQIFHASKPALLAATARGTRRAPEGQKHLSTLPWMGQSSSGCLATLPCCPSLPALSASCSLTLAHPCLTLPARAALPGAGAAASELSAPRRRLVLLPWRSRLALWMRMLLHQIKKVRVCSSLSRSLL